MGALTIRNVPGQLIAAIKRRAADGGVSMEHEIRRLLHATYADDRDAKGRAWARRQLTRLKRGELPKTSGDSSAAIRAMRKERTDRISKAEPVRRGRRR